jgi:8-oxo-dGTP diphosphatase
MNIKFDYVAGFLFSKDFKNVALIHKQKPAWQKGKFNAIGGKIEPDELADDAMRREFREETGLDIPDWKRFCVLRGDSESDWRVYFYFAVGDVHKVQSMESEIVKSLVVNSVLCNYRFPVIPNLRFLIPMALSFAKGLENCSAFQIVEVSQPLENAAAVDTIPPRAEADAVSL